MKDQEEPQSLASLSLKDLSKEQLFDLEMAEVVWMKVKGYPIPDCYSVKDRLEILQRYWHRAIEKE